MCTERPSCPRSLFGALSRRVGALQMSIIYLFLLLLLLKSKILAGTEIFARDEGKRESYTYC